MQRGKELRYSSPEIISYRYLRALSSGMIVSIDNEEGKEREYLLQER